MAVLLMPAYGAQTVTWGMNYTLAKLWLVEPRLGARGIQRCSPKLSRIATSQPRVSLHDPPGSTSPVVKTVSLESNVIARVVANNQPYAARSIVLRQ